MGNPSSEHIADHSTGLITALGWSQHRADHSTGL